MQIEKFKLKDIQGLIDLSTDENRSIFGDISIQLMAQLKIKGEMYE